MSRQAHIISVGRYVPAKALPNAYFNTLLGRDVDTWLVENVGIRNRHVMAPDENTSDLGLHAARQALERAGLEAADLDLIIFATDTPDYISPATASVLQHKLGARRAGTFDVNCACAGWVTALDNAARYVLTDTSLRYVLVVGAYGMTRYVDDTDVKTCTLFADGAGAVIVGAREGEAGWLAGHLAADGSYYDALGIYTGGIACPVTPPAVNGGIPRVQFVRKFPATFNAEQWPRLIHTLLDKVGVSLDEVALFLFTQLNLNTIRDVMGRLGQPLEKTHWIMDKWGYTGSACIPMALDDILETRQRPRPGDLVLFLASGGGIALAGSLWRWGSG